MSDYRLGLKVEDVTDDAGNRYSVLAAPDGRRFAVMSYDMRLKDYPYTYREEFEAFRVPKKYDLNLGLTEVPEPPAPPEPKRTWARSMGLRKPDHKITKKGRGLK